MLFNSVEIFMSAIENQLIFQYTDCALKANLNKKKTTPE